MTILVLAFLGGVLTILSPCVLPILPLVFARSARSFTLEIAPLPAGLAVPFTPAAITAPAPRPSLGFATVVCTTRPRGLFLVR